VTRAARLHGNFGRIDPVGAALSVLGMGGVVLGILVWQEGGVFVGLIIAIGVLALGALAYWLQRRKSSSESLDSCFSRSPLAER
jgi:hypothetical protein